MRTFSRYGLIGWMATLLLTAVGSPAEASSPLGDDRNNGVGLYLWATGIDGEFTVMGNTVPVDVSFDELFDQVEIAGSIHYERTVQSWGVLADVTYIDMGAEFTEPDGRHGWRSYPRADGEEVVVLRSARCRGGWIGFLVEFLPAV